jgi:hypothetical protein
MKLASNKRFITAILALVLCQTISAQSLPKTMRRLPDTGQTQSYTNTPGEDADFSINSPFFIQNGDGTVTDTVTGLMWQQTDGGEMTIENATTFCENLTIGGHDDWRLPTTYEAYSMLNHGKSNPALDIAAFTNTVAEYWWTSQHDVTNASKIWVTNKGGGIGNHLKTETVSAGGTKKIHVRAVREIETPPTVSSHFSDNSDGTITDHLTDLVWQKTPAPDSMTWESALVFSANLSLAGHDDWRLPNIKELQSLSEVSIANPSVNSAFFPQIGLKKYWASTSLPNQTTKAWYLDTRFGITTYAEKTGKLNLLCVRGGQNGSVSTNDLTMGNTPIMAFPNPFADHVILKNAPENVFCQMSNALGQVVFSGTHLEKQDLTKLPPGLYTLKISGNPNAVFKLLKS